MTHRRSTLRLAANLRQGGTCISGKRSVPALSRTPHRRTNEVEERREFGLDSTLAETFPCSDPLSSIPNPSPQRT